VTTFRKRSFRERWGKNLDLLINDESSKRKKKGKIVAFGSPALTSLIRFSCEYWSLLYHLLVQPGLFLLF